MRYAKSQPNDHRLGVFFAIIAASILLAAGCGTVTPTIVESPAASYDGGVRNSGELGFVTNGLVVSLEVTPHWRDRYNAMIADFGARFKPAIKPDYGVTVGDRIFATPEAVVKFTTMNRWRKTEGK